MSRKVLVPRHRASAAALPTTVLALLLPLSSALAADLSPRRPVVVAPSPEETFSWTGYYGGLQAGYARNFDHAVETFTAGGGPTGLVYDFDQYGGSFGAKVGANYQIGMLVTGIEADIEAADIKGGFVDAPTGSGSDKIKMQGSVRARLGLAYDRVFVYGTGGLAFAQIESLYTFLPTSTNEYFTDLRTGWTVGAGADWAITSNWIIGVDYRHSDYGKINHVSNVAFPGLTGIHEQTSDVFHLSVSYKY